LAHPIYHLGLRPAKVTAAPAAIGHPPASPVLDCAPAERDRPRGDEAISDDSDELDSLFSPSPLVGEGGRRRRSDEGCRRKVRCSAPQPCDSRTPGRSHPSSVRLRLPPSPTRGEGSLIAFPDDSRLAWPKATQERRPVAIPASLQSGLKLPVIASPMF